jgi:lipopolysaccharide assembly protein A
VRIFTYILILIIILFGLTFATLNSTSVTVDYYFSQSSLPLSLILVIAFALGCLLGILAGFFFILRAKMTNYRLKQRLNLAEREIANLRAIPLQDKV